MSNIYSHDYPIDGILCAATAKNFGAIGPSVCSLVRAQPPLAYFLSMAINVTWGDQCAPFAEKASESNSAVLLVPLASVYYPQWPLVDDLCT